MATPGSGSCRQPRRHLAEFAHEGKPAGHGVEAYLDSDDWVVRVAAARTLGLIGFKESTHSLLEALDDPRDWRLDWVTARTLWQLEAQGAVDGLEELSQSHWYPPVREMAAEAAAGIRNREWRAAPQPTANVIAAHEATVLFRGDHDLTYLECVQD